MRNKNVHLVLITLIFGLAPVIYAQEKSPQPAELPVTIQGEVIDPAIYLREGLHGSEMADKTYEAVDGGQSLALLEDKTGTLYLFLAAEPGEDPNELVYDAVNTHVKVTGTLYERGGLKGIVATAAEPLEPSNKKAPDSY